MSDSATVPSARKGVLVGEENPVARVQADLFCEECGANLFGLPVWRTQEGGLLVVRCPACSELASANAVLPGRETWRRRTNIALLLVWIAVVFGGAAMFLWAEAALQQKLSISMNYWWENGETRNRWVENSRELSTVIPLSLLTCFFGGCILSGVVYHWRAGWHVWVALAMPALAGWLVWREPPKVPPEMDVVWLRWALLVLAAQMAGGVVGVLLGRPFVRLVLRALLPESSLQYYAFLWRRDGKRLPPPKGNET